MAGPRFPQQLSTRLRPSSNEDSQKRLTRLRAARLWFFAESRGASKVSQLDLGTFLMREMWISLWIILGGYAAVLCLVPYGCFPRSRWTPPQTELYFIVAQAIQSVSLAHLVSATVSVPAGGCVGDDSLHPARNDNHAKERFYPKTSFLRPLPLSETQRQ